MCFPAKYQPKTKRIRSSNTGDEISHRYCKSPRISNKMSEKDPITKNMSVDLYPSHINYLNHYLMKNPNIRFSVKNKNKQKNLAFLDKLYKNKKLYEVWDNYFKSHQLYRDILGSNSMSLKKKRVFNKKLWICEHVFRKGIVFNHFSFTRAIE